MRKTRNWMWFDFMYGFKFLYYLYFPCLFFVSASMAISPVWRKLDERYALRYAEAEIDAIDTIEPFVTYTQRKKPITRKKYSEAIKIVYNGQEEFDYIPEQPQRYR